MTGVICCAASAANDPRARSAATRTWRNDESMGSPTPCASSLNDEQDVWARERARPEARGGWRLHRYANPDAVEDGACQWMKKTQVAIATPAMPKTIPRYQ